MTHGLVFDIRKYSIHDGPGIRTTVFFKGCPLSCWWCHNPESQSPTIEMSLRDSRCIRCGACVDACPHGAVTWINGEPITDRARCERCATCATICYADAREPIGRDMTVAEVMAEIETDVAFYDQSGGGVTFSGGEPLLQRDFLLELLRACKAKDIHTAVDTSGFATWSTLDRIRRHVDLFLYDLKLMDDDRHHEYTGVSNRSILSNLQALSDCGHNIIIRVPIIPGINDDDETIRQIADFTRTLPHVQGVDILPYHHIAVDKYLRLAKPYRLFETRQPSDDRVAAIAQTLRSFNLSVTIGG
ncbi:MAG TPA: glycyl-radical enzyme activating protein [Anaerolineae bacterium]|nr:glycyl-radical enzyme activating protein [Anaerolineae bacterium]